MNDDELMVGVCYRTNNETNFDPGNHQELRDLLTGVSNKKSDFNYSGVNWNSMVTNACSSLSVEAKLFSECLEDNIYT